MNIFTVRLYEMKQMCFDSIDSGADVRVLHVLLDRRGLRRDQSVQIASEHPATTNKQTLTRTRRPTDFRESLALRKHRRLSFDLQCAVLVANRLLFTSVSYNPNSHSLTLTLSFSATR